MRVLRPFSTLHFRAPLFFTRLWGDNAESCGVSTALPPIVCTDDELLQVSSQLAIAPWATLDTEFMRESTYFPQLCLVQIATPDALWLLDPLVVDLAPLWETLNTTSAPIVLHSAEQDLELIYLASGRLPPTLRDSQIAAAFLGLGDQIGYGNLVQRLLDFALDKSQSRTNWAQRPLTDAQRQYAADDVRYLAQIYPELRQRLADTHRLTWFDEECAMLSNPQRFEPQTTGLWRRVRGQQQLRAPQRVILDAIATWREHWARQLDLPRRWVLSDEQALELANSRGFRADLLHGTQNFRHRLTTEQISDLRATMDRARQLPVEDGPQWRTFNRLDPDTATLLALLQSKVHSLSQELGISAALLATADDILQLMRAPDAPCKLNQGWRNAVVGLPLKSLLP